MLKKVLSFLALTTIVFVGKAQVEPVQVTVPFSSMLNDTNSVLFSIGYTPHGFRGALSGRKSKFIYNISYQDDDKLLNVPDPDLNFDQFVFHKGYSNYIEGSVSCIFPFRTHFLSLSYGFGSQSEGKVSTNMVQLDWGNESRLINAGFSFRVSRISHGEILYLYTPMIQGKLKLGNFRVVNQYGLHLTNNGGPIQDYPIYSLGFEYLFKIRQNEN